MSDTPPPPVNSLSTFGIPPLPPLKDDVIFEQDLDQISVQLYYSRGFKVNMSGTLLSALLELFRAILEECFRQLLPSSAKPQPSLAG